MPARNEQRIQDDQRQQARNLALKDWRKAQTEKENREREQQAETIQRLAAALDDGALETAIQELRLLISQPDHSPQPPGEGDVLMGDVVNAALDFIERRHSDSYNIALAAAQESVSALIKAESLRELVPEAHRLKALLDARAAPKAGMSTREFVAKYGRHGWGQAAVPAPGK